MDRRFRVLRRELSERGVSEELRGWSFEGFPVQPPGGLFLFGVSELAGRYCRTMRDLYLRKILRVPTPPSVKVIRGIVFHDICHRVILDVKRVLFEEGSKVSGFRVLEGLLPQAMGVVEYSLGEAERRVGEVDREERGEILEEAVSLYRFLIIQAAAKVDWALSKYPHATADSIASVAIPPVVERKVDGSLVGLGRELSVDLYTPYNAVADLKTGEVRSFHPYAVTGYALALEAEENIPIDYGFIVYVKVKQGTPRFKLKCFVIGDEIRREFLELRDEAYEVLTLGKDPGKPPRCPKFCPYYEVCSGGES